MEKELKTFKDIKSRKTHTDKDCVSKDFLRKEAKNWVEELKTTKEDYVQLPESCHKIGFYHQAEKKSVIKFIEYFFNLKEEK